MSETVTSEDREEGAIDWCFKNGKVLRVGERILNDVHPSLLILLAIPKCCRVGYFEFCVPIHQLIHFGCRPQVIHARVIPRGYTCIPTAITSATCMWTGMRPRSTATMPTATWCPSIVILSAILSTPEYVSWFMRFICTKYTGILVIIKKREFTVD